MKELLSKDLHVHMLHILQEGNACENYLVKLEASSHETCCTIVVSLAKISLLLPGDPNGTLFST